MDLTTPPGGWPTPEAAYVHVPFCRHRCGYCNFSVVAGRDDLAGVFLRAIASELQGYRQPVSVETLFIGGGTPTHLPAAWLTAFLDLVTGWFRLRAGGEFSIEANPSDISEEKLAVLRRFGVNRISLGVQSFADRKLRFLERDHDHATAAKAIEAAAESIGNVSVDLIFGADDEPIDDWRWDLQQALQLPIRHISTYALTYEKGTRFWSSVRKSQWQAVDESTELAMYQMARQHADAAGLRQYEISNFAAPGFRCRHNLHYWQGRGWYACGPGAAGFTDGVRYVNHRSPTQYIRRCLQGRSPRAEQESISPQQWACERAAFGVRMLDGIDLQTLGDESGWDIWQNKQMEINQMAAAGLILRTGSTIRLTETGIPLADSVAGMML